MIDEELRNGEEIFRSINRLIPAGISPEQRMNYHAKMMAADSNINCHYVLSSIRGNFLIRHSLGFSSALEEMNYGV